MTPTHVTGKDLFLIRSGLRFSRTFFGQLLNVSARTIEKWEQNPHVLIKGSASVLIYLIDKNNDILKYIYDNDVNIFNRL